MMMLIARAALAAVVSCRGNVRLTAPVPEAGAWFGAAVAMDGGRIVAGAPLEDAGAANAGAIHVFDAVGAHVERVTAAAPEAEARFGSAVALGDDLLVVGAPATFRDGLAEVGAVHVLRRTAGGRATRWAHEALLESPDADPASGSGAGWRFGSTIALAGGRLVIAAPEQAVGGVAGAGAVHVFERRGDAWERTLRLVDGSGCGRRFGAAVAWSDGLLVVGAPGDVADGSRGCAHVYRDADGWSRPDVLAPAAGPPDGFGSAVAIGGGRIVVAAPWHGARHPDGALHVFTGDGAAWIAEARLDGDAGSGERLGESLCMTRAGGALTVAAGAVRAAGPDGTPGAGVVRVFHLEQGGWRRGRAIRAALPQRASYFGFAVASAEARVAAGAPFEDVGRAGNAGAVVVATLAPVEERRCSPGGPGGRPR